MILIFDIPVASIAVFLIVLSLKTLGAIKHLGVGKSFWIPILSSGIFFFAGSLAAILTDLGMSFLPYAVEIEATCQLIGLCVLLSGIYMYSRKITKNLVEKFIIPVDGKMPKSEEKTQSSPFALERIIKKTSKKTNGCNYHFGYLRTMPKDTSLPEECLGCNRVIECKHSQTKKDR
jgi:hypothetical protein